MYIDVFNEQGEKINTIVAGSVEDAQHTVPPGHTVAASEVQPPPAQPRELRLTKRSFQNRFPLAADGISRKYDLMSLFLSNEAYAASLVADPVERLALQMKIQTGVNRLAASPHVDLVVPEAAGFTWLLVSPEIPAPFRLSQNERSAVIDPAIADHERFRD